MRPKLQGVVFLLVFFPLAVHADFRPVLSKVSGIPNEGHCVYVATPLFGGWITGTTEGVLAQSGEGWITLKPPVSGEVRVIQPISDGLLVAGAAYAFVFADNRWRKLALDDVFDCGMSN